MNTVELARFMVGKYLVYSGHGLWIGRLDEPARPIGATARIGLSHEIGRPLRFFEAGSPFFSGPRRLLAGGVRVLAAR